MIVKYPVYYKDFKCIADKCPDTCCSGWQIVVDEKTAEYYNNLNTDFGLKIQSLMYKDNEGDIAFKNINNRCPFLDDSNLCDIYINIGEDSLCNTCKKFPRFTTFFGGVEERGLSLSCPVAAEMIVNNSNLELSQEINDLFPDINDIDADLYLSLVSARKKVFNYINSDKVTAEMLSNLLSYGKAIQSLAENQMYEQICALEISNCDKLNFTIDFDSLFSNFEYLTQEGKTLFSEFNSNIEISNDKLNNILNYYIYRYFLKSVYDMNIFAYVALSVFSVFSIAYVAEQTQSNITHISQIYSKEIEHSNNNFNSIIEYFNR
ncbi:MAG: flagellin lysine-N-methylase [Ruminococcus sp.]